MGNSLVINFDQTIKDFSAKNRSCCETCLKCFRITQISQSILKLLNANNNKNVKKTNERKKL